MLRFYTIYDQIAGHLPIIVKQNNLVKVFGALLERGQVKNPLEDNFIYDSPEIVQYTIQNNIDIYLTLYDNFAYWELDYKDGQVIDLKHECEGLILDHKDFIKLYNKALEFNKKQKAQDIWPGQYHYLALKPNYIRPFEFKLPIKIEHKYIPKTMSHKSHSRGGYFKHLDVGHTMSANARANYLYELAAKENHNLPLRHRNRHYFRHHIERFPWCDDFEYTRAQGSTGWKGSTKARKQYLVKVMQKFKKMQRKAA